MTSDAKSSPRLRYVVLRHEGISDPHFDLMLETAEGSALATWRSTHWPPEYGTHFTRLPDHRRNYLTYEGPISGDRGNVRRVAAGRHSVWQHDEALLVVRLDDLGRVLRLPRA